jgi:plastocyanin
MNGDAGTSGAWPREAPEEASVSRKFVVRALVGGVLSAAAVAGVAAATAGTAMARAGAPVATSVEAQLFRFRPARVLQPGTRVQWTNRDDITHTVTAGTPEAPQSVFRLVLDGRGVTASATFDEAGIYLYFCERHQHMRGEIRIE